jgi:hypothetical protein
MHPAKQLYIWLSTAALVPVSCLVEASAIIYAIARPVKVFEVVDKN